MLSLDDERWKTLRHAYGEAGNIPDLLRRLSGFPPYDSRAEPCFSLWSTLCHQGDVYSASYAAVRQIVRLMEFAPDRAHWSALLLVAGIEIARRKGRGPALSPDLAGSYKAAMERVPAVVAAISTREWDEISARVAASAVAAAKGQTDLAEAILELEPSRVPEFMEWVVEQ